MNLADIPRIDAYVLGRTVRENLLKRLLEDNLTTINGWVSVDSPYLSEVLSYSGLDSVTVDLQHGMFGFGAAVGLLQGVCAGPATPMARCVTLDGATIGKLLDAGAYGIICPAIDTVEQARALVAACRYPPRGVRSFGPARGLLYGGSDYVTAADSTILSWAMIESVTALANLDEIVAVPGLSGVFVGPNDLALSLGERPGQWPLPATVWAALERIVSASHSAGIKAGIFCVDAESARALAELGFDLLTPGTDVSILRAAVEDRVAAIRDSAPRQGGGSGY